MSVETCVRQFWTDLLPPLPDIVQLASLSDPDERALSLLLKTLLNVCQGILRDRNRIRCAHCSECIVATSQTSNVQQDCAASCAQHGTGSASEDGKGAAPSPPQLDHVEHDSVMHATQIHEPLPETTSSVAVTAGSMPVASTSRLAPAGHPAWHVLAPETQDVVSPDPLAPDVDVEAGDDCVAEDSFIVSPVLQPRVVSVSVASETSHTRSHDAPGTSSLAAASTNHQLSWQRRQMTSATVSTAGSICVQDAASGGSSSRSKRQCAGGVLVVDDGVEGDRGVNITDTDTTHTAGPSYNDSDQIRRLLERGAVSVAQCGRGGRFNTRPVRNKRERQQLPGWKCDVCRQWYEGADLSESQKLAHMHRCSRHRDHNPPRAQTPPGFWDPVDLSLMEMVQRSGSDESRQ